MVVVVVVACACWCWRRELALRRLGHERGDERRTATQRQERHEDALARCCTEVHPPSSLADTHAEQLAKAGGLLSARRRELCTPTNSSNRAIVAVRQQRVEMQMMLDDANRVCGKCRRRCQEGSTGAGEKKKNVGVARAATSRFTAGGRTAPSSSTMVSGRGPDMRGMLRKDLWMRRDTVCMAVV